VRLKTDLEPAYSNTPCKQIQPLSKVKTLNGPRVHRIIPLEMIIAVGYLTEISFLLSDSVNWWRH